MNKKIILQIDGGGIRGLTPAIVLCELEKQLREARKDDNFLMRDMLTLCCGTSTGAIMAGFVVTGVNASDIKSFYLEDGISLFKNAKNPFYTQKWLKPKFKRDEFQKKLDEIFTQSSKYKSAEITLKELPNSLMVTAYNLSSHRTHFIKSLDDHDKDIKLKDAIAWSALSAAKYFGSIQAPDYNWIYKNNDISSSGNSSVKHGAVFQDGGQGTQNCTLDFVLTEILSKSLGNDEEVIIISLGTGGHTKYDSYDDVAETSILSEMAKYLPQARDESTAIQVLAADYVQQHRRNIKLFRLNYESEKDYDLDDVSNEAIAVYKDGADYIIKSDFFNELIQKLK
jgi:patatin-like phospholipase/acyl hydrolase